MAVGFELQASLITVAPRISVTSQRMGTDWNVSSAAAISARSKPIIRPTATADSAAVRWWRPQTGTENRSRGPASARLRAELPASGAGPSPMATQNPSRPPWLRTSIARRPHAALLPTHVIGARHRPLRVCRQGSSASTACPLSGSAASSSDLASATASRLPDTARWPSPMGVITPTFGAHRSDMAAISPRRLAPNSSTA